MRPVNGNLHAARWGPFVVLTALSGLLLWLGYTNWVGALTAIIVGYCSTIPFEVMTRGILKEREMREGALEVGRKKSWVKRQRDRQPDEVRQLDQWRSTQKKRAKTQIEIAVSGLTGTVMFIAGLYSIIRTMNGMLSTLVLILLGLAPLLLVLTILYQERLDARLGIHLCRPERLGLNLGNAPVTWLAGGVRNLYFDAAHLELLPENERNMVLDLAASGASMTVDEARDAARDTYRKV